MKSLILLPAILIVSLLSTVTLGKPGSACVGHGHSRDPTDCGAYFQCHHGSLVKMRCSPGLNWNDAIGICDWPHNAPCNVGGDEPVEPSDPQPEPQPEPEPEPEQPGDALVTEAEFKSAAETKYGNPDSSYYHGFIKSLPKASITTRREAILFLSHAVWETVGFQYTKEVVCQTNLAHCAAAYPNLQGGLAGKVYYGRGMMQLTWDYNYRGASHYLYGNDRLIQDPDVVGNDPEVGWATAAWYWHVNVHHVSHTFGSTLKAINGALECEGGPHGQNRYLRFMHYKDIMARLGEPEPSDDDGWCTAW